MVMEGIIVEEKLDFATKKKEEGWMGMGTSAPLVFLLIKEKNGG